MVAFYVGETNGFLNDAVHLGLGDGSLERDGVGEMNARMHWELGLCVYRELASSVS
jgi:hypothetical protein